MVWRHAELVSIGANPESGGRHRRDKRGQRIGGTRQGRPLPALPRNLQLSNHRDERPAARRRVVLLQVLDVPQPVCENRPAVERHLHAHFGRSASHRSVAGRQDHAWQSRDAGLPHDDEGCGRCRSGCLHQVGRMLLRRGEPAAESALPCHAGQHRPRARRQGEAGRCAWRRHAGRRDAARRRCGAADFRQDGGTHDGLHQSKWPLRVPRSREGRIHLAHRPAGGVQALGEGRRADQRRAGARRHRADPSEQQRVPAADPRDRGATERRRVADEPARHGGGEKGFQQSVHALPLVPADHAQPLRRTELARDRAAHDAGRRIAAHQPER